MKHTVPQVVAFVGEKEPSKVVDPTDLHLLVVFGVHTVSLSTEYCTVQYAATFTSRAFEKDVARGDSKFER
jgi:hypothetical protein